MKSALVAVERIERAILVLRGHKVMLDSDLAELYGVETKVLLQAVKRNLDRFPKEFMLRLSTAEFAALRSQFVTSNPGRGGPPLRPLRVYRARRGHVVLGAQQPERHRRQHRDQSRLRAIAFDPRLEQRACPPPR